jgi:hypothetical protein
VAQGDQQRSLPAPSSGKSVSRAPTAGRRGWIVPPAVGFVIGLLFIASGTFAFHDPRPHDLPVAVVGSPRSASRVQEALARAVPGGFDVHTASFNAARSELRKRDVFAAYLPRRRPELLVAGANGPGTTAALASVFANVAEANHEAEPTVRDVRPLAVGDARGLSLQQLVFGIALACFLFGLLTGVLAPRLPLRVRLASLAVFTLTLGLGATIVVGPGLDAIAGSRLVIAAVVVLLAAAMALTASALVRLLGPPGIGVAAILLLIVGNGTSGATIPYEFLPDVYRQLSQALPNGAGASALLSTMYFDVAS